MVAPVIKFAPRIACSAAIVGSMCSGVCERFDLALKASDTLLDLFEALPILL
jgi:hypothetical protein